MSSNLPYRSRAVRAMVLLHEEHLRRFVHVWRLALESSVSLPPTDDPAYASLEALGRHVLSAAGGYERSSDGCNAPRRGNLYFR